MNELITQYLPMIGVLAFVVSAIVDVTKDIPYLKSIPTDLEVIVLSIVLTVVAYLAYMSYADMSITWYYVVGAVVTGFFVAFITMYGWTKFTDLFNRLKK